MIIVNYTKKFNIMYPAAYKRLTFLSRLVVWYSIPVNADVSDRIAALPDHITGVSIHRVDAAIFYPFYQSDVISSAITVPKGFARQTQGLDSSEERAGIVSAEEDLSNVDKH